MTDLVCPLCKAFDNSSQDPWMVAGVDTDVMVGLSSLSKHRITNRDVISLS